jgi:rhodanese-related sulfurtransferase
LLSFAHFTAFQQNIPPLYIMTDDYDTRAKQHGFASKETVRAALKEPDAVVLDVRGEAEIVKEHYKTNLKWVHTACTPTACPLLEYMSEQLLPDKNAPVIIHCASGRRAVKAEQVLKSNRRPQSIR